MGPSLYKYNQRALDWRGPAQKRPEWADFWLGRLGLLGLLAGEILSELPSSRDCLQKPIGRRCSDAVLLILGPFACRIMPLFVLQKAAKGSNTPQLRLPRRQWLVQTAL